MEIPVIDLQGLTGDASQRSQTMARLHEACKDWGFFWVRTRPHVFVAATSNKLIN